MEEMWKTWKKDDTAPRSQLQNENGILRLKSRALDGNESRRRKD